MSVATVFSNCETLNRMPKLNRPEKRPPGRPKKAVTDKPEQFSVRLPPKLKFGLELLARAQHRSLSQVVEWAVQMGMNTYEVGRNFESLTDLLTAAWKHEEEGRRLLEIYRAAPALLSFEDAAVCELVDRAADPGDLEEHIRKELDKDRSSELTSEQYWNLANETLESVYWPVVWRRWDELRQVAVDMTNSGRSLQMQSVAKLLDLKAPKRGASLLDIYRAEAKKV